MRAKENKKRRNEESNNFIGGTLSAFIWLAIGIIIVLALICFLPKKKDSEYRDVSADLSESITVDLKEYFGQYLSNQKGEIKELTNTVDSLQTSGIELTQEQQDALIKRLVENLTPEMIQGIMDRNESVSKETIESLEQSIYDKLVESLNVQSEKVQLTESQMQAIGDSVTMIVETNILSVLEERFEQQTKYLVNIEAAIDEKLKKLTDTVTSYQETVKQIESKIKVIEKNTANSAETEKLRLQLEELQRNYESFIATAQPAINIVTNLAVYPTGSNDVLSAQAGYNLNQKIVDVKNTLSTSFSDFSQQISAKVEANDVKQSQKLSDAKNELESQIADNTKQVELLDKARQAAEKALETKAAEDVEALTKALEDMNGNLSDDLKNAYDNLLQMDKDNAENMRNILADTSNAINADIMSANNNITSLRSDLNDAKNTLSKEIQQMGDNVNNNIVAKMPTYVWSDDGKELTITIPRQ